MSSKGNLALIAIIGGALLFFVLAVYSGFVGMMLWNWFIPTTFESAPYLNIPTAIGIAILVRYWTNQTVPVSDNRTSDEKLTDLVGQLLYPLIALGIGWAVYLWL